MRAEYFDPIERFSERIDQLLDAINRVSVFWIIKIEYCLFILALYESKSRTIKNATNCCLNRYCFDHYVLCVVYFTYISALINVEFFFKRCVLNSL
jgi:hypothetical protein